LIGTIRDGIRLDSGKKFRTSRSARPEGRTGGFLGLYDDEELKLLQAGRIRWISKSIPDPRDGAIRQDLARVYWRIAVSRHQSSQMVSELFLIASSTGLGVTLAWFWNGFVASGFQISDSSSPYLFASVVLFLIAAFAVATKVGAGRRWEEAIEAYRRVGWPRDVRQRRTGAGIVTWWNSRTRPTQDEMED
jgi:hypothetical protein